MVHRHLFALLFCLLSKEVEGDIIKTYVNDVNGNRKQFTLKEGTKTILTASYTYDKLDRPTGITFSDGVSVSYTYDDNGKVLTETRGSEVSTYTYNDAGFVTGMANTTGADYSFTYRLDGNQVSRTTDNKVTNYTYNNLGQLTGESGMDWQAVYTYDTRGNRATAEISDGLPGSLAKNQGMTSYTYDLNNRLLEETNAANGVTRKVSYEYDPNGNILFKGTEEYADMTADAQESLSMSEDGTAWYTYDVDNRLVNLQRRNENGYLYEAEYRYDAAGRRSGKTVNGLVTNHIWDGDHIVYERDENKVPVGTFYRGLNLVAYKIGTYVDYYLYDQKGSVTGGVNRTGTTEYDAFGVQRTSDKLPYNPFRYNGEYYDQESGLIYLRNRYYDPATGRFMTEDPYWNPSNMIYGDDPDNTIPSIEAMMQSSNLYVYCVSNPVMFVDPSGYLRAPGYNKDYVWSENPDLDDYGANSVAYNALLTLSSMWDSRPSDRAVIERLANLVRSTADQVGYDFRLAAVELIDPQSANEVDIILAVAYPVQALEARGLQKDAVKKANEFYGQDADGTIHNAFKHAYWNALMAYYISDDYAQLVGYAHEFGAPENLKAENQENMNMDLYNNYVGRDIAWNYKKTHWFSSPKKELANKVKNAAEWGSLVILR